MKKLVAVLSLLALWPAADSPAQLRPPNEAGVGLSHWHTIVRDVEATKKFWMLFGGTSLKVEAIEVIKSPGVLVFMTPGLPQGGSAQTAAHHVGFAVPSVQDMAAKLEAAGVKMTEVGTSPLNGRHVGHLDTPDGLELEITEAGADPYPPLPPNVSIESNHIHFRLSESARREAQGWYARTFGGKPGQLGNNLTVDIPGVKFFRFATRDAKPAPTKGRALDHLGFEVKNLEAFCKKLEANGVKFAAPYSKTRHPSFASAELTDPWGVSIELTEGLNRF